MDNETRAQIAQMIDQQVTTLLRNFNSAPVATHTHNKADSPQLDPAVALTGFPVFFVADASVAPTTLSQNGTFRFQTDFKSATAHFWLWAYLVYYNASNVQVSKWVGVQLS